MFGTAGLLQGQPHCGQASLSQLWLGLDRSFILL